MAQSDQPTSTGSTARKGRPGGLFLIEVVAMLLILGGITGYLAIHFIVHKPGYSDDPRLDRAARVLVAYFPRGIAPTGTSPLTPGAKVNGSQMVMSAEDSRKMAWMVPGIRALQRCLQTGQSGPGSSTPPGPGGGSGSQRQGVAVDVESFRTLWALCSMTFGRNDDRTQVLFCALGFPWDFRDPQQATGTIVVHPSSSPPVGSAALERCLSLAANAPGWGEADQMLQEKEGLSKDQRLYVRAELVGRALADPFATAAACDHAAALLQTHAWLDASGAQGFLALLAMRAVVNAPAAERPALIRTIRRAHPFLGTVLQYMPYQSL